MRSTRLTLAVTALSAVLALAGCGGDDSKDEKAAEPEKQADCQASVELTGAVKDSWSGEAYVITGGDKSAFYKTSNGDTSVSIIPGQDDVAATPIVTAKGLTYTVQAEGGEVEVDPDGEGASVDADADATQNGKKRVVHVVADFDC